MTGFGLGKEKEGEKTYEMGCEGPDGDKKGTKEDKIVHSKSTDSKVCICVHEQTYMYFCLCM